MSEWISLQEVLADMERITSDEGSLYTFSLTYVRHRDGRNGPRGSLKHIKRGHKGVNAAKKGKDRSIRDYYRFKDHDQIPIQDLDAKELNTPKWTHLMEYNGMKVKHYG